MKQKSTELKRGINKDINIVRDFNAPLSGAERTTEQKISRQIKALKNNIKQHDIINIYTALHPTKQNTLSFQTSWNQDTAYSGP